MYEAGRQQWKAGVLGLARELESHVRSTGEDGQDHGRAPQGWLLGGERSQIHGRSEGRSEQGPVREIPVRVQRAQGKGKDADVIVWHIRLTKTRLYSGRVFVFRTRCC